MTDNGKTSELQFSVDELGALAEILGVTQFPGVPVESTTPESRLAREAATTAARRGLVARGLLLFSPEGTAALEASCSELVMIPLTAELVVAAERRSRNDTFVQHYYVRPDVGVEHGVVHGSIHRLARFPSEELLSKVVEFMELTPRNGTSRDSFTTDAGTFGVLREGLASGDFAAAREALGQEGGAFVDAIEDFVASARVQIVRQEGNGIEGGEVLWVDAGGSLWLVEPLPVEQDSAASEQRVTIASTSAGAIVDELLGFLIAEKA